MFKSHYHQTQRNFRRKLWSLLEAFLLKSAVYCEQGYNLGLASFMTCGGKYVLFDFDDADEECPVWQQRALQALSLLTMPIHCIVGVGGVVIVLCLDLLALARTLYEGMAIIFGSIQNSLFSRLSRAKEPEGTSYSHSMHHNQSRPDAENEDRPQNHRRHGYKPRPYNNGT